MEQRQSPEEIKISLGKRIRELRESCGLKILDLAAMSDSDVGNISRIERGKQWPSEKALCSIAMALNVTVADLFAEPEGSDRRDKAVKVVDKVGDELIVAALRALYRERQNAYQSLSTACRLGGSSVPPVELFGIDVVENMLLRLGAPLVGKGG